MVSARSVVPAAGREIQADARAVVHRDSFVLPRLLVVHAKHELGAGGQLERRAALERDGLVARQPDGEHPLDGDDSLWRCR